MKVLLINGSPKQAGCTYTALQEISGTLNQNGIETEILQIGKNAIRGCTACGFCKNGKKRCVYDDDIVNTVIEKAGQADGFIFGSPVYYAAPNGSILSLLDRAFYAGSSAFCYKPGAAVVSARRGGTTASFDVLNKYFTISQMPVVSSQYWCMVHGNTPEEVRQDEEGLQIMRTLGRNMAWLLNCIQLGKENGIIPQRDAEQRIATNFIS